MELIIVLAVVAVIAMAVIGVYNGLIQLKNKVDEAWADIDTQLKRRYDLIPNMVEIVKGYAKHESKTLEAVTQARNMAMAAKSPEERIQAENALSGTLKTLFAVAENYPDLKANQNFMDLQATLKEVEDKLQLSRRYHNATVRDFNTKVEIFPNNIVAGIFHFGRRKFFEIENAEERNNVKVSFNE
ncbi:LemA family protein [Candidatus Peregrinibacteria bacterium]|nr:LemA family protein [Candidatus Peregrinibacteria bacterium]